ncbi:uncharacterized protein LOC131668514 [Phymastichus coffea]|uniref:uncharacterized protein LOC131668514 n=1 Tax=Phymastichus coffea TaxID=108790 RepID=UPI00273CDE74|nr:uncharacterized protein LOC131668514 [Phymastichus coffea]XP_058798749.1 uncharacterized protein LOC131668514 [Phymastichus coffea]XP_058798750.1 uncharacterized protein LOC131668514 [Phymastichus coffea]
MDFEKVGCYKLYRCKSLLACDSGGTVYDTSQRFENSVGQTLYKNVAESQSESGESENIIYIIDKDYKFKSSPLNQQADTNYCLVDDNNCEPCLNVTHVKEENSSLDDNCKYYIVQCDDVDSTQNSTLDSDSFDGENFEYYCDSINLSSPTEDPNSSNNNLVSENIFIGNQEEARFHNLCNFSQESKKIFNFQELDGVSNHSPINPEIQPIMNHTRKRKQSYQIKSNSFTELLEDDDSSDASVVSETSKKNKTACSKIKQSNNLQSPKYNPFEKLKMSSILKRKHYAKKQIQLKECTRESLAPANDENSELSNVSSSDEVFSSSEWSFQSKYSPYFSSNDTFYKIVDTFARLNSDLTNADYLEYVQPREKIVESDMDKLLSPTIEMSMIHCEINQQKSQVDCNGNDVINHNLKISASETVEKQLISKAVYAIKLGFQNIFNTSNECVIDEILYDHPFTYKDIQLEIDLVNIRKSSETKIPIVLLENNSSTHDHHHHNYQLNDPFKNVSCSLKDTLNEFDNFGGFSEDHTNKEDIVNRKQVFMATKNQDINPYNNSNHLKSNNSFSSLVKTSLVSSDINANYDFTKFQISNTSIHEKQSIAPLKMRIKRLSNNNQYVIDDPGIYNVQVDNKATWKFQKNSDSKYECSYCLEKFRTKRLLKSHISENHKGPYDMECEICHMKSKKSSAYKKHKPWCEKSTALKCEICQKIYCYKAVLLRHINTHKDRF